MAHKKVEDTHLMQIK